MHGVVSRKRARRTSLAEFFFFLLSFSFSFSFFLFLATDRWN